MKKTEYRETVQTAKDYMEWIESIDRQAASVRLRINERAELGGYNRGTVRMKGEADETATE